MHTIAADSAVYSGVWEREIPRRVGHLSFVWQSSSTVKPWRIHNKGSIWKSRIGLLIQELD